MRIAIIEDEIRIREGLGRLIEKLSGEYQVVGTAENGQEGLELIRQTKPDVVVTDIKMPELDGLEMLELLYREGYKGKAVMLSAYSEFEYARQAMRLGVKEYLLKPIVVSDIAQALLRVKTELRRENVRERLSINSRSELFTGILWGNLEGDETVKDILWEQFGMEKETRYIEFCLYLGNFYEKNRLGVKREAERLLRLEQHISWECLESGREKMMVFLIYGYEDPHGLERFIQREMLRWKDKKAFEGIGFTSDLTIDRLREGLCRINEYMEWNISLGDDVLISYPKVTALQTSPCIYPMEIERQIKVHICTADKEGVEKDLESFERFFQKGGPYEPREIKECYVRFLWAMINVAKEVGMPDSDSLEQQTLLEQVMGAKTRRELRSALTFLAGRIQQKEEKEAVHLTVKRAQSLIQEFYRTGITLEEIAEKLNITPEYLGTRFHKELGVNFSTYIKNFRMAKAKEMLISTQMKLYEIAEKVGYSDPKYFSRVFKETTGQLPADYRKTHK